MEVQDETMSNHLIAFKGPDDERAVSRHELLRYQAGELDEARRSRHRRAPSRQRRGPRR